MCIWLLVASLSLGGQTLWPDGTWCVPSGTTPERMLLEERNLWLGSTNPAALGVRPMPDYGTTRLGATSESGAYRRPQQAAEALSAGFHSDSYLSLKGLHLWGAFDFTQKWHRNRAWADIRDPYNGNPYSAGSAVASRYQEQTVDFQDSGMDIEDGVQEEAKKDIPNTSGTQGKVHYIDVIAIIQDLNA